MWMRGESFGLHEAIVEYFEDDDGGYAETRPPVKFSPEATQSMAGGMKVRGDESSTPGADMGLAAEADNRGDVDEMRGDADSSNAGEEQSRSFSELQQLRVLVRRKGGDRLWGEGREERLHRNDEHVDH